MPESRLIAVAHPALHFVGLKQVQGSHVPYRRSCMKRNLFETAATHYSIDLLSKPSVPTVTPFPIAQAQEPNAIRRLLERTSHNGMMLPCFLTSFCGSQMASPFRMPPSRLCARRRRPVSVRRETPTCVWVERSATVLIEMGTQEAYNYYIDLEAMPEWSPWLRSVEVDRIEPDVSRWTLAARGIEISWKARNTKVIPGELISWKSESGLSNRGRVAFVKEGESKSNVTLAVEFDVPKAIARAIDNDFIGRFVEETILADMKRFRSVALAKRRKRVRSQEVPASVDKERN